MASVMRSVFSSTLVSVVVISSVGATIAQAPAPGPGGESAAAGLLPASIVASLDVALTGFVAARYL
ncbi:hypothetical protein Mapa_006194 [Marchantia paleacea]|nr:hypothetical protein Mapa_006194 [Marchantia paleacea]